MKIHSIFISFCAIIVIAGCSSKEKPAPKLIQYQYTGITSLHDDFQKVAEISQIISIGKDSLIVLDRTQILYLVIRDSVVKTIGNKGGSACEYSHIRSVARNHDTLFVLDSEIGKVIGYSISTNRCLLTYQNKFLRNMGSLIRNNGNFISARPIISLTDKLREGSKMPLNTNTDYFLFAFTFDSLGQIQKQPLLKNSEKMQFSLVQYLPVGTGFTRAFTSNKYNILGDVLLPQIWLQDIQTSKVISVKIILNAPNNEKIRSIGDASLRLTDKLEKDIIDKCEYIEYINILNDTIVVASKFVASDCKTTSLRFYNFSGNLLASTEIPFPKDALSFQCISIENGQAIFLTTDIPKSTPTLYPYSFRRMKYSIKQ